MCPLGPCVAVRKIGWGRGGEEANVQINQAVREIFIPCSQKSVSVILQQGPKIQFYSNCEGREVLIRMQNEEKSLSAHSWILRSQQPYSATVCLTSQPGSSPSSITWSWVSRRKGRKKTGAIFQVAQIFFLLLAQIKSYHLWKCRKEGGKTFY